MPILIKFKRQRIALLIIGGLYGLVHWYNSSDYTDPDNIDPKTYKPLIEELNRHRADTVHLTKDIYSGCWAFDADYHMPSRAMLPKTYDMMKQHQIYGAAISPFGIFVILKKHEGTFNIGYECIKTNPQSSIEYVDKQSIQKQVPLKNGWVYQQISVYTAD